VNSAPGAHTSVASSAVSSPNWVLERWAIAAVNCLRYACLFFYFIDLWEARELAKLKKEEKPEIPKRNWDLGRALWLLGSLALFIALWWINPGDSDAKLVFGGVAGWRLYEILVTGFGTALGQRAQVRARNLVSIVIYGLQLTLIFAILYHSFATAGFAPPEAESGSGLASSDYLYISWSAITSLGSTFEPTTEPARFLEVATTTAGIFLLGVLLAFGINEVQKKKQEEASGTSIPPARDGQPGGFPPGGTSDDDQAGDRGALRET
jgi:hypothetical protein